MSKRALLLFLFLLPMFAFAQRLSHPLAVSSRDALSSPALPAALPDTVQVLAVMVQFQKDADTRTSGDGWFVRTAGPSDTTLDAPPHDAAYFRDHLQFLENYFRRVSKGKVIIRSTLIDSVVTLSAPMASYAPARNSANLPVANLARDAWHAVDSLHLVPAFHLYESFVVFHAGAGRDVDLVGQLGYDPTPLDIPSLYLGLNAFRGFYGADWPGITVEGGGFQITNSMVIPETESRLLPGGAGGDVLLELGINGLLCASMGNFLGLPDLFNTATGASGIGRFGLMDGQAIFSFSGAFPPEPSAWEKYWLGWLQPVDVPPGRSDLVLPAVTLADTVFRVSISSQEYYLLENRNRDPFRTGVTVASTVAGTARQQTFTRDVTGFNAYDITGLAGVVTDVSVPDWSLPGATDPDGTFYDGGVIIWHIDEAVIARGLADNTVNASTARRGVDVVEADGSQDIGQSYGLFTGGSGSEQGTPLDFWFLGNIAPLYRNMLSATTLPDSRSNLGATTHITVGPFSPRAPHMTVSVERGDAEIVPLASYPKVIGQRLTEWGMNLAPLAAGAGPALIVSSRGQHVPLGQAADSTYPQPGRLFAWTLAGGPAVPFGATTGLLAQVFLSQDYTASPAVADIDGDGIADLAVPMRDFTGLQSALRVYTARDVAPADSLADLLMAVPLSRPVLVPPVFGDSLLVTGDNGGRVYFISRLGAVVDSLNAYRDTVSATSGISRLRESGGFLITADDGTVRSVVRSASGVRLGTDRMISVGRPVAGAGVTALVGDTPLTAFATVDGLLYCVDNTLTSRPGFPVQLGGPVASPPAWADIDGDGFRDIVVCAGSRIAVLNRAGVMLEGFPATVRGTEPITSAPVVGDVDGDGLADIIAATGDGVVAAVDRRGRTIRGFPLAAGRGQQTLALFDVPASGGVTRLGLAVASSENGAVNAWTTGPLSGTGPARPWGQYMRDPGHGGVDLVRLDPGAPASAAFFPPERAYCWPNPVYEGRTAIRYFVGADASVNIKIFDLAGDLVTEMRGTGSAGVDNEVAWDVTGVQSGVYLARIEAVGGSSSAVQIVKIAVVR